MTQDGMTFPEYALGLLFGFAVLWLFRDKRTFLAFLMVAAGLGTGCQSYRERFTYLSPATGATNHVVDVSFRSCLIWGKAAKLRTETQTMEFIRSVNAEGLESRPDPEAVKAIAQGVADAVLKSVTPKP